jgi:membrane protease YdiL (CAAX protease family)
LAVTLIICAITAWLIFGRVVQPQIYGQLAANILVIVVVVPLIWRELRGSIHKVPIASFINYAGLIYLAFAAARVVLYAFGIETIALPGPSTELERTPILTAIAYSVVGPINEELLFRGYLFPRLLPLGFVPAALISTGIWTGLHFSFPLPSIAGIFFTGLVMAWVMNRTGSVWVTIAGHMLINAQVAVFYLFMIR